MSSGDEVTIKIIDTGCGIPKSFRHALFQPFRQADSSLTRPKQGTGLGLSIVKHLVQRMAGTVDVESIEGEGSTFTVKLPVTIPSRSASPSSSVSSCRRLKIVYRYERTARLLVKLLTRLGLVVTLAPHTASVSELRRDTDVICTDVESIQRSSSLMALIDAETFSRPPTILIFHSDSRQLSQLKPALSRTSHLLPVKRPIVTHALLETISERTTELDPASSVPRVRFMMPAARSPPEQGVDLVIPESLTASQETVVERPAILLVEDNMVCSFLYFLDVVLTVPKDQPTSRQASFGATWI
jgi:hypothetical protein